MSKYVTTLNIIRDHQPCADGWEKLLKHLGKTKSDDEPLDLLTILDSNGLDDALWCLRALPEEHHPMMHALACDFAERGLRFIPPDEPRPAAAIAAKRAWLRGGITTAELAAARDAAWAAAWDAWDAARAAWYVAGAAAGAAWAAAEEAEREWQEQHFRKMLKEAGE